jgi:hypothetical protein
MWKAGWCAGMRSSREPLYDPRGARGLGRFRPAAPDARRYGARAAFVLWLAAPLAVASVADTAHCGSHGAPPVSAQASAATELRRVVERSPLYRTLVAAAAVQACDVRQSGDRIAVVYAFRDGASLRVERAAAVEYTSQEARVGRFFRGNAMAVLERVERAAFGKERCGIDWRASAREPVPDRPRARLDVFTGVMCNCQARIGRDERGRVETLAFRSAC